ncbi:MAG: PLP-dependent transferase [Planctomycetes bacterium]|nr:PLP-dependent transferase [Planctomycetota bacterium]
MNADGRPSADTLAVHSGIEANEHRAVVPPIYQTSTFAFDNTEQGAKLFAGDAQGYIYSRMGNPTVEALEKSVAALEGGYAGLACGSGMAAIHTTFAALLSAGDHLVCSDAVYGPTCTLLETVLSRFGIDCTFVDASDVSAIEEAMRPETKFVFVETPGNPTLVISDLEAVGRVAHAHGALLVVDNTFMTPILQQPFSFGADVVIHSLTKFLNGHADVVGGMIVVKDEQQRQTFRRTLNHLGGVLPPFESFLVHRGIKTLAIRMRQHCESALQVARFLEQHPAVEWIRYPGLPSHPQHEIACRQMTGHGGMISFGLNGGLEAGRRMMNAVKLCGLAVSLGGVESLVQHPASMTHASMGAEARRRANITDGLVRLSVGIEGVHDIIEDLDQAMAGCTTSDGGARKRSASQPRDRSDRCTSGRPEDRQGMADRRHDRCLDYTI